MTQAPGRFIHAHNAVTVDPPTWDRIQKAHTLMRRTFPGHTLPPPSDPLLFLEATASSAIENVHDEQSVTLHQQGLTSFLHRPFNRDSLLHLHHEIMTGQPHAEPGRYRTIPVTVGDYRPPLPQEVPSLMDEFFTFFPDPSDQGPNDLLLAAWAHLCFEHIHPFADGNGRTGRAITNRILQSPIPLSYYIFSQRPEYYLLLSHGTWPQYLDWFIDGILFTCHNIPLTQPPTDLTLL